MKDCKYPTDFPVNIYRPTEGHIANVLIRSGLFGVTRNGANHGAGRWIIEGPNGLMLTLEGQKLSQRDLDVWLVCLNEGATGLGRQITFSIRNTLKTLGVGVNGRSAESLRDCLTRLNRAHISISQGDVRYDGRLIHTLNRDLSGTRFVYSLDPHLVNLWSRGWTRIDLTHRARLGRNQYAKWLHAYFSSHERIIPHSIESLRVLCGCENGSIHDFRKKILAASKIIEDKLGGVWKIDSKGRYLLELPRPAKDNNVTSINSKAGPRKKRLSDIF